MNAPARLLALARIRQRMPNWMRLLERTVKHRARGRLLAAVSFVGVCSIALLLAAQMHASRANADTSMVSIGGQAHDLEADYDRNLLYVSVSDTHDVAVFDMDTLAEVRRVTFPAGYPQGIDLSLDGSRLFVALGGTGSVGIIDLSDFSLLPQIDIEAELGYASTWDVVEGRPNRLYVSANPGSYGFAWIVQVRLDEGNAASRISDRIIRDAPALVVSRDQRYLYVGEQYNESLYKFDISTDAPVFVLEDIQFTVSGTGPLDISGDGNRLFLYGGSVVRSETLMQGARLKDAAGGTPRVSRDGAKVLFSDGAAVTLFDTDTYALLATASEPCGYAWAVQPFADDDGAFVLGPGNLCRVPLDQTVVPTPTAIAATSYPRGPSDVHALRFGSAGISDIEADYDRGYVYASLRAGDEILVLDMDTLAIERVIRLPGLGPDGLELSIDKTRLLVALGDSGALGVIDLNDWSVTSFVVDRALETSQASDAVEVAPGRVILSGDAFNKPLAILNLNTGQTSKILPAGFYDRKLVRSEDGRRLYVGSQYGIRSIDLTVDPPVLLHSAQGDEHLDVSPDGSLLYLSNGRVLNAETLEEVTTVPAYGAPRVSRNAEKLLYGDSGVSVFDRATLAHDVTFDSACAYPAELEPWRDDGGVFLLGRYVDEASLCSVSFDPSIIPPTATPTATATSTPTPLATPVGAFTGVFVDGDPGDPVTFGNQRFLGGQFSGSASGVYGYVYYSAPPPRPLTFLPPPGEQLAVGTYVDTRPDPRPGHAGLEILGSNSYCVDGPGRFTVHEIVFNGDGSLARFAASFEYDCAGLGLTGSVYGEARFNSTVPFPAVSVSSQKVIFDQGSGNKTITVKNVGSIDTSVRVAGILRNPDHFHMDADGCTGNVLTPAETCDISVQFSSSATPAEYGSLLMEQDGLRRFRSIELRGFSPEPTPVVKLINPSICLSLSHVNTSDSGCSSVFGLDYATWHGNYPVLRAALDLGDDDLLTEPSDFDVAARASAGQLHQLSTPDSLGNLAVIAFVPSNGPVLFQSSAGFFLESGTHEWWCTGDEEINPDPDCGGPNASNPDPYQGPDHVVVAYLSCSLETCPNLGTQDVFVTQNGVTISVPFTIVGEPVRVDLSASPASVVPGDAGCELGFGDAAGSMPYMSALTARAYDANDTPVVGAWLQFSTANPDESKFRGDRWPTIGADPLDPFAGTITCARDGTSISSYDVTARLIRTDDRYQLDPSADPSNADADALASGTVTVSVSSIPAPTWTPETPGPTRTPSPTRTPTLTPVASFTPTSTRTPTPTKTPTITPTFSATPAGNKVAIDVDLTNGGGPCAILDNVLSVQVGSSFPVAVCLENNGSVPVAAFGYHILYPDAILAAPEVADAIPALDDNPDANSGATTFTSAAHPFALGANWDCSGGVGVFPKGNKQDGIPGSGEGAAYSGGCGSSAGPNTLVHGPLGVVTFNTVGVGDARLTLTLVSVTDNELLEIGSCSPVVDNPIPCIGALINVKAADTPTPNPSITVTSTPTATSTVTNTPTITPTFTSTPTRVVDPEPQLSLDMDVTNGPGACDPIDAQASVQQGATFKVAVCLKNTGNVPLAGFNYRVQYDDNILVAPEGVNVLPGIDANPDANAGATTFSTPSLGVNWRCAFPMADLDGVAHSGLSIAHSGACDSAAGPNTLTQGPLGEITFNAIAANTAELRFESVYILDNDLAEVGSCNPPVFLPMPCNSGTIVITEPPTSTATATNTSVATATPTSTNTATNTPTSVPTSTNTATPTATNTPVPTSTKTPTATSTMTPTATVTRTNTATPTRTSTPTAPQVCQRADLTGDGRVNERDVVAMLRRLLRRGYDARYDLDGDRRLGIGDLFIVLRCSANRRGAAPARAVGA